METDEVMVLIDGTEGIKIGNIYIWIKSYVHNAR